MLLDALKDIVKHTHSLGFIEMVKLIGTPTDLKMETMDADKSVIIYGSMYQPEVGIESTIGLSRLALLKGSIDLNESSTVSIVTETRLGEVVPTEILFLEPDGSTANYRFVSEAMISEQVKVPTFKGAVWDVVFAPSAVSIANFAKQYGVYGAFEKRFIVSVDAKGTVKFSIGNGPTDRKVMNFAAGVTGTLKHQWTYPLSQVLAILKLTDTASTSTMHFSDGGALKIEIDSGIGKYTYILPAGKA